MYILACPEGEIGPIIISVAPGPAGPAIAGSLFNRPYTESMQQYRFAGPVLLESMV